MRITRDFEDLVAWLAQQMAKSPIAGLLRIGWDTVDQIVERVVADTSMSGVSPAWSRSAWTRYQNGELDRVLVVVTGEPGRTPADLVAGQSAVIHDDHLVLYASLRDGACPAYAPGAARARSATITVAVTTCALKTGSGSAQRPV